MATSIYLGNPPENIKKWIMEHVQTGPVFKAETYVIYDDGTRWESLIEGELTPELIPDIHLVKDLYIGTKVTSIGYFDAYNDWKLTNCYIPNTITSVDSPFESSPIKYMYFQDGLIKICEYICNDCGKITDVRLPNDCIEIGECAFKYSQSLDTIIFPNTLKIIGNKAFQDSGLKNIIIPASVNKIGSLAFYDNYNLNAVILGTDIEIGEDAFSNIKSLTFKNKTLEEVQSMDNYPWGITDTSIIKTTELPADPEEPEVDMLKVPLTFTAKEPNSNVTFNIGAGEYVTSFDGQTWNDYTSGTEINLLNINDKVMFRAKTQNDTCFNNYDEGTPSNFVLTGKIAASGNIQFLLDSTGKRMDVPAYCFNLLFGTLDDETTALLTAPELPATTLGESCYANMFQGCTSLTQAPALPATTLGESCYANMFNRCTSLTQAPALPATTLADYCYSYMFQGCTSLTQAPALPATTLAEGCYNSMFQYCSSLTQAPALPATTLADWCYEYMFQGCESLTQAPTLPAIDLSRNCYSCMFKYCDNIPEPKYNMSHMTFDEVANAIQNNLILGEEGSYEIQCSDKILVATIDEENWEWSVTEK